MERIHFNNNINNRYEKTVCYSISNSSRNFEYQNPYKTNEDITGRGIRHYAPSPSKEIIPFSQRQVYAQPNSKRTLVPELAVRYIYNYLSQNQKRNHFEVDQQLILDLTLIQMNLVIYLMLAMYQ